MSEDKAKGESIKRVRRETGGEIIDLVRGTGESVGRLISPQKEKGGSTIFNRTGRKDRRTNLQGVRKHRRQSVKEGAVTQGVGNPDTSLIYWATRCENLLSMTEGKGPLF